MTKLVLLDILSSCFTRGKQIVSSVYLKIVSLEYCRESPKASQSVGPQTAPCGTPVWQVALGDLMTFCFRMVLCLLDAVYTNEAIWFVGCSLYKPLFIRSHFPVNSYFIEPMYVDTFFATGGSNMKLETILPHLLIFKIS